MQRFKSVHMHSQSIIQVLFVVSSRVALTKRLFQASCDHIHQAGKSWQGLHLIQLMN